MALRVIPVSVLPNLKSRGKTVVREAIPYNVPVKGSKIRWLQDDQILVGKDGDIAASGATGASGERGRLGQREAASLLVEAR